MWFPLTDVPKPAVFFFPRLGFIELVQLCCNVHVTVGFVIVWLQKISIHTPLTHEGSLEIPRGKGLKDQNSF